MKKSILLIFFASLYAQTYSQDLGSPVDFKRYNVFGIYYNIGICEPLGYQSQTAIVSSHGKSAFSYGFKYLRPISQKLKLEAGICYSKYIIVDHLVLEPSLDDYLTESLRTMSIPVLLKKYYQKNYFLSLGTLIEFGLSRKNGYLITDTQTGFGLSIGAGKEISINNLSFEIAPKLDLHSIIPFSSHLFQQKLLVLGLKIGLNYKIN